MCTPNVWCWRVVATARSPLTSMDAICSSFTSRARSLTGTDALSWARGGGARRRRGRRRGGWWRSGAASRHNWQQVLGGRAVDPVDALRTRVVQGTIGSVRHVQKTAVLHDLLEDDPIATLGR